MRPSVIISRRVAYVVAVQDLAMAPAFEPQFQIWIDPSRSVAPGHDVLIELSDGRRVIRRLLRRTRRLVICRQWNPARDIEIPADTVKAIHRVVGQLRVMT